MTDPAPAIPPAPKPVRLLVLAISALVALTMVGGVAAALFGFPKIVWGFLGFEAVGLIAAVMGVLAGLGRFRDGFGLALVCIAGTIVAGALFGLYLDARVNATTPEAMRLVRGLIVFRGLAAVALAALAAIAVLARDRRSWGLLIRGAIVTAPVLAVLAWVAKTRGAPLTTPIEGVMAPVRTIAVVLGGLVLMVLFSVGAHLCIRAFEITRPDDRPNGAA